jgi:hypothetical protein
MHRTYIAIFDPHCADIFAGATAQSGGVKSSLPNYRRTELVARRSLGRQFYFTSDDRLIVSLRSSFS